MIIDIVNTPTYWFTTTDKEDRMEVIEGMFLRLGFSNVTKHVSERVPDGRVGCTIAHMKAQQAAEDDGNIPALFLEDDCLETKHFKSTIEVPDDADAIYLGHSHWGVHGFMSKGAGAEWSSVNDDIIRVYNMLAAHAVLIINPEYLHDCRKYHKMNIEGPWWHDCSTATRMKYWNVYAPRQPYLYQREQISATERSITEYNLGDGDKWLDETSGYIDEHFFTTNNEVWCGKKIRTREDIRWEAEMVEIHDHHMPSAWAAATALRGYKNGQPKGEGCDECE